MGDLGMWVIRGSVLFGCAQTIAYGAATELQLDVGAASRYQAVVLVSASNVFEHRLPGVLTIANGRFIASSVVENACARSTHPTHGTLLFFPESNRCEKITNQNLVSLRDRLRALTGRWLADPLLEAQNKTFISITPLPVSPHEVLAMCGCSVDQPPDGTASCTGQVRTVGALIGNVEFDATDPDTATLTSQFSYQIDTDPAQSGLPSGLSSSCSNGSGSLQCVLSGTAPAPAGALQISLDVSDGTFTLPLETRIDVLAVGDRIFADGFEPAGCP